ncbi:MAG: substrate-binding domain-containing protein [Bacillota bacterium]
MKRTALIITLVLVPVILAGTVWLGGRPGRELVLATTTSTEDSGLLDYLLPYFTERTGIQVKVVAVGTGQALEMGRKGDADVLLVHAKPDELKFVADGYGTERHDVMYNDFIIIGPAADPAGIKGLADVKEAFRLIAAAQATFVSRGDNSGTHKKEKAIWAAMETVLAGDWYVEVGQGMGATLGIADEKQGYLLIDRATYLAQKASISLEIMVEGDELLLNQYGVIPVNPARHDGINERGARMFVEWLISDEAQELIGKFGVEEFGQPLFFPNAGR